MTQPHDKAEVLRMADDLHGLANYHRGVRNFADAKVLDQADAMLRSYAEVLDGWRPIETAPKEGTPIFVGAKGWPVMT